MVNLFHSTRNYSRDNSGYYHHTERTTSESVELKPELYSNKLSITTSLDSRTLILINPLEYMAEFPLKIGQR